MSNKERNKARSRKKQRQIGRNRKRERHEARKRVVNEGNVE